MKKIGTATHVKATIKNEDFHIKKKFGQNFLVDQNILQKIVEIPSLTKESLVIEIGPGMGSLTEHLLNQSKHVLAYEIDSDLIPILKNTFKNSELTIKNSDFLKCNIDEDIKSLGIEYDRVVVVANLPYYITTPIIMKIIEESKEIKEMVLMMQLEVARRFTSKPSTKDYNSLSIAIQYKTDAQIALKVPRTVFIPAPNVDSAIVKLVVKDELEVSPANEKLFYKIVRASFSQRRKTLANNLFSSLSIPKAYTINMLEELNYNTLARAESLSVTDFIQISDYMNENKAH
jgi:16S rRNA (adenine1518-N6/adenine1519-N6)-dimethyltransferase